MVGRNVHQLVYNLEDYANSGGVITSSVQNPVRGEGNENPEGLLNIYNDILIQTATKEIFHVGIQAPPGTKFEMTTGNAQNIKNTFVVGRTGIYELNEDIRVRSLKFLRPVNYYYNQAASEELLKKGTNTMANAKMIFDDNTDRLFLRNEDYKKSEEDWQIYRHEHNIYVQNYEKGLSQYLEGLYGVYTKSPGDLRNVIIDYIVESNLDGDANPARV